MTPVDLSTFTPSMATPEALEATFVQRHALADRLVAVIRESATTDSKHHVLMIGPRGIGKTHLVSIVYHRIKAIEELDDRLVIAWLREDEYGVCSFLDLLLRILRALQEECPNIDLAERIDQIYDLDSDSAEREAQTILELLVGGRTLAVMTENLDDIFSGLGPEGQRRVRAYMQEHPYWCMVATSQSLFPGVSRRNSPFYGFFDVEHLEPLTLDDARELLIKIAEYTESKELVEALQSPMGRARVRAVDHLAGGCHRVYMILSRFLTRDSLDDLVEALTRTMDELTPYYQSRMAYLSQQQRKIVEWLCDHEGACQVKEIAKRCFLSHQVASSQLGSLRDDGYVISSSIGRDSFYELREPLMRICLEAKKKRGQPIGWLVDFFRLWYSTSELEDQLLQLACDESSDREYVLKALELNKESSNDPKVKIFECDYDRYLKSHDYPRAMEAAEELVQLRGGAFDIARLALSQLIANQSEEAAVSIDRSLDLQPDDVFVWWLKGAILLKMRRFDEALEWLSAAIDQDDSKAHFFDSQASALLGLDRMIEALESYRTAAKLEPNKASRWGNVGFAQMRLDKHQEALQSFDKCVSLDPDDTHGWMGRCRAQRSLGQIDKALKSAAKAISINQMHEVAWILKAELHIQRGDVADVIQTCKDAIEIGCEHPPLFYYYASYLELKGKWKESLPALQRALKQNDPPDKVALVGTASFLFALFVSHENREHWGERARDLIRLYKQFGITNVLSTALVLSITPMLVADEEFIGDWLRLWSDSLLDREEYAATLRMLRVIANTDSSVRQRALLDLPNEHRSIVSQLIDGGDGCVMPIPAAMLRAPFLGGKTDRRKD